MARVLSIWSYHAIYISVFVLYFSSSYLLLFSAFGSRSKERKFFHLWPSVCCRQSLHGGSRNEERTRRRRSRRKRENGREKKKRKLSLFLTLAIFSFVLSLLFSLYTPLIFSSLISSSSSSSYGLFWIREELLLLLLRLFR